MQWISLDIGLAKHPKMAELPNDTCRYGWIVTLCEAKAQTRPGVFASHCHFREVLGRFGKYLPLYLGARLLEENEDGSLSVHDWKRHQWAVRQERHRRDNSVTPALQQGERSVTDIDRDIDSKREKEKERTNGVSRRPVEDKPWVLMTAQEKREKEQHDLEETTRLVQERQEALVTAPRSAPCAAAPATTSAWHCAPGAAVTFPSPASRAARTSKPAGGGRLRLRTPATARGGGAVRAAGDAMSQLTLVGARMLAVLADGEHVRGVARRLFVTESTVKNTLESAYRRLGVPLGDWGVPRARRLTPTGGGEMRTLLRLFAGAGNRYDRWVTEMDW